MKKKNKFLLFYFPHREVRNGIVANGLSLAAAMPVHGLSLVAAMPVHGLSLAVAMPVRRLPARAQLP